MLFLLYICCFLLVMQSFGWKLKISTSYAFLGYSIWIFGFNPSLKQENNVYVSLFLLFFALGCFFFKKETGFLNFLMTRLNHLKKTFLLKILNIFILLSKILLICGCLCIYYKSFHSSNTYEAIRINGDIALGYFFDTFFWGVFFVISVYWLVTMSRNFFRVCLLCVLVSICSITQTKSYGFELFFCLILFIIFYKKLNLIRIFVSLIGLIFVLKMVLLCCDHMEDMTSFIKRRAGYAISDLGYLTMDFARENNYITYGKSSWGRCFLKKGEITLSKISMNLYHGCPPFYDYPGANCAPTSALVGLYVDFRYIGLIFAFILGAFLRRYDAFCFEFIAQGCQNKKLNKLFIIFYVYNIYCTCTICTGALFIVLLKWFFLPFCFLQVIIKCCQKE